MKFTIRELLLWTFIAALLALGLAGIIRPKFRPPMEVVPAKRWQLGAGPRLSQNTATGSRRPRRAI